MAAPLAPAEAKCRPPQGSFAAYKRRQALDIGTWQLGADGDDAASGAAVVQTRLVVSRFAAEHKHGAGILLDGWHYELFGARLDASDRAPAGAGRTGTDGADSAAGCPGLNGSNFRIGAVSSLETLHATGSFVERVRRKLAERHAISPLATPEPFLKRYVVLTCGP